MEQEDIMDWDLKKRIEYLKGLKEDMWLIDEDAWYIVLIKERIVITSQMNWMYGDDLCKETLDEFIEELEFRLKDEEK